LEQLYPLPFKTIDSLYQKYQQAGWYWVQEEPLNMGAASFLQMNLKSISFGIIGRQPSAATASGHAKVHRQEQEELMQTAFSI
jgi:2-oxoglutarate dehydrogenase E1 component